jgi:hypothetical protein
MLIIIPEFTIINKFGIFNYIIQTNKEIPTDIFCGDFLI